MFEFSFALRAVVAALSTLAFSAPVMAKTPDLGTTDVRMIIAAHDDRGGPASLDDGKFGANLDDGKFGRRGGAALTAPR